MKLLPLAVLLTTLVGASAASRAAEPACPGNPDALGTSRTITIGEDAPKLGLKSFPHTLALADHEVVLTFDDGPLPATTRRVLAALAHECVRATFFLIGRNAAAAPALVKAEIAAGHSVGHHTFSHPEVTERGLSDEAARADIDRGFVADDTAAYGAFTGEPRVPFFRYPGFGNTPALDSWLAARRIAVFGADLWASDWIKMTPDQELSLLMQRLDAAGKGIILLHDIKAQTADMLPRFLRDLKEHGYRVVHMVPGKGTTPIVDAPQGWSSETDKTLATILPKLLQHAGRAARPKG